MDYKENRAGANLAQRDVAVFFAFIGNVPDGYGIGIVEHKLRRLEIDVVLCEILLPLPLIALETHGATTLKITTVHIVVNTWKRTLSVAVK